MPDLEVELRPLDPDDRVTGLKLGDAAFTPLKTFFQKRAKSFHENDLAKTYVVATNVPKIVGYITLVSGEIATDEPLVEGDIGFEYSSYPAVKIARLAVHVDYAGSGIGRSMVEFALGSVKSIVCPAVGCRFVVVDAKKQSVGFYRRCGFTLLDTPDNAARPEPIMFVDLTRIAA